jgi:hypothetical protein
MGVKLSREERKPRVSENRVLRRIFEPKRDEVTGEWRKMHNEELNDLNCSPNTVRTKKLRIIRCIGYVAIMGERRALYRNLEGKPVFTDLLQLLIFGIFKKYFLFTM